MEMLAVKKGMCDNKKDSYFNLNLKLLDGLFKIYIK